MPDIKITKNIGCIFLTSLVVVSCLPLMDSNDAKCFNDWIAPEIIIETPVERANCSNIEEVSGRVTDLAAENGVEGEVRSLTYQIAGSKVAGKADLLPDKRFSFRFVTETLTKDFVLQLTASDWNDNQTTINYSLSRDPGNGIPSFTVTPGNKEVVLTWAEVPGTESYTLYYTTNDSLPSEKNGIKQLNVSSPYTIKQLENGRIHVFRLKTNPKTSTDWPESWSDYKKALPLSPRTLAPRVTSGNKSIQISWNALPEVKSFQVWRSDRKDAGFDGNLTTVQGTSYTDSGVMDGQWYYYKIYPEFEHPIASDANGGETCRLREKPFISQNILTSKGTVDIAISGHYAYLATRSNILQVIDITSQNPSNSIYPVPNPLNPGTAKDLAISGHYAYVAAGEAGLHIIDISTPEAANVIKTVENIGDADNIEIAGNFAYVGVGGESCLRVINIQNPHEAHFEHDISLPGNAQKVAIANGYAYISIVGGGLYIFEMISPTEMVQINSLQQWVNDITIEGSYAYLVESTNYFKILDISNPEEISEKKKFWLPYTANWNATPENRIVLSGAYAYVTSNKYGLYCISIYDPLSANIISSVPTPGRATNLAIYGSTVYVADGDDVQVIETGHLSSTELVGPIFKEHGTILKVAIDGSYAYAASINSGLWVIDINNSSVVPHKVEELDNALDVVISGDYAYVAAGTAGLKIVDISDPLTARVINIDQGDQVDFTSAVDVSGDFAYVLVGLSLQVVDISDPSAVSCVGVLHKTGAFSKQIIVSGNYAYLAKGDDGLLIADVHDPHHPELVKIVNTGGYYANGLDVRGTIAYVAAAQGGLKLVDISNPSTAEVINTVPTPAYAYNVICAGSYAFVMDSIQGVQVVDISNTSSAKIVSSLYTSELITQGALSGNRLFVVSGSGLDNIKDIHLFP